jgi:hypothetical protein
MNKTRTFIAAVILASALTLAMTIIKQDTYAIGEHFWLKSKLNGMVIDIRGANMAQDTPISTYPQKPFNQAANQLWRMVPDGVDGYSWIKTKLNGMVLDIRGANTAPDTIVSTYPQKPFNQAANQLWRLVPDGVDGHFWIKSKLNGMVLDIRGAHTESDTPITTYFQKAYPDATNQLWRIVH